MPRSQNVESGRPKWGELGTLCSDEKLDSIVVQSMDSRIGLSAFEPSLHHLLAIGFALGKSLLLFMRHLPYLENGVNNSTNLCLACNSCMCQLLLLELLLVLFWLMAS